MSAEFRAPPGTRIQDQVAGAPPAARRPAALYSCVWEEGPSPRVCPTWGLPAVTPPAPKDAAAPTESSSPGLVGQTSRSRCPNTPGGHSPNLAGRWVFAVPGASARTACQRPCPLSPPGVPASPRSPALSATTCLPCTDLRLTAECAHCNEESARALPTLLVRVGGQIPPTVQTSHLIFLRGVQRSFPLHFTRESDKLGSRINGPLEGRGWPLRRV